MSALEVEAPEVSVVIVHLGPSDLLRGCLQTLNKSLGSISIETIVVDNLSGAADIDEIAAVYPHTRVIRLSERLGYGAATNRGIGVSRGRYILWCNNDLLFRADAVDRLASFLDRNPEYGAACPRLLNADGSFQACFSMLHIGPLTLAVERLGLSRLLPWWDLGRHWVGREADEQDVAVAGGACSLLRRTAFDTIGGALDERFFLYFEEYDLSRRLSNRRWRVRYLPSAQLVHLGSQTTVKVDGAETHRFVVQAWRSKFAYVRKYYGPLVEAGLAALFVVTALPRWAAASVGAAAAEFRHNPVHAADLRSLARLHAYSARMALSAERRDASHFVRYPSGAAVSP